MSNLKGTSLHYVALLPEVGSRVIYNAENIVRTISFLQARLDKAKQELDEAKQEQIDFEESLISEDKWSLKEVSTAKEQACNTIVLGKAAKQNWFDTLRDSLNSENLQDQWPLGLNIEYGQTVRHATDDYVIIIYRNENGRYERPVHYKTV